MHMVRHHDKGMHVYLAAILEQTVLENYCSCFLRKKKSLARAEAYVIRSTIFLDMRQVPSVERHLEFWNVLFTTVFLLNRTLSPEEIVSSKKKCGAQPPPAALKYRLRRRGRLRSTINVLAAPSRTYVPHG